MSKYEEKRGGGIWGVLVGYPGKAACDLPLGKHRVSPLLQAYQGSFLPGATPHVSLLCKVVLQRQGSSPEPGQKQ